MKEVADVLGILTLSALIVIGAALLSAIIAEGTLKILRHRPAQATALSDDDPLVDTLHQALANRTGKLRISDAYLICDIEPGKATLEQISRFSRAIRELGWERQRRRFNGTLQYAYARGTAVEREVELVVHHDPDSRTVRIETQGGAAPVEDHREAVLKSIAAEMRFGGSAYSEIATALIAVNKVRCVPPMPDTEIKVIALRAAELSPGRQVRKEQGSAP